MFELIEINPPLDVLDDEYRRLLGFPKSHQMTGRPRELADAARQWYAANGRPWIYAREVGPLELRDAVRKSWTVHPSADVRGPVGNRQLKQRISLPIEIGLSFCAGAGDDVDALGLRHLVRRLPKNGGLEETGRFRFHTKQQIGIAGPKNIFARGKAAEDRLFGRRLRCEVMGGALVGICDL